MSIAPLKLDNDIQFIPSSICLILYPMKKETTTKITKKADRKGVFSDFNKESHRIKILINVFYYRKYDVLTFVNE